MQNNTYPDIHKFSTEKSVENINWMIEIISAIRKTRSEIGVKPNKEIEIMVTGENDKDKLYFKSLSFLIMSLAKVKNISFKKADKSKNYYTCVSNNLKILIPSSDLIDIKLETDRLTREKEKYISQSAGIEERLSKSEFINNAPGHIVVADEQKLKELKLQIQKIDDQLKNYS